jgi:hypothetical protein
MLASCQDGVGSDSDTLLYMKPELFPCRPGVMVSCACCLQREVCVVLTSLLFSLGGGCQASPTPHTFSASSWLRDFERRTCRRYLKGLNLRLQECRKAPYCVAVWRAAFLRQARHNLPIFSPPGPAFSAKKTRFPTSLESRPVDLSKPTSSRVLGRAFQRPASRHHQENKVIVL